MSNKTTCEGKDPVFGDALNSIEASIRKQDQEETKINEAKKSKKKVNDPLKAGTPTELKGDGKKDMKIKKMEGINPDDSKDNEGVMIQKLTEESDISQDVKDLIAKAKEALDKSEYEAARGFCDRLEQVQMAVREPEKVELPEPGNTGIDMSAVDVEEETEEEDLPESKKKVNEDSPEDNVLDSAHEQFIRDDRLQEMIDKALDNGAGFVEAKKDPKAKTRNRGDVVFPAESPKVTDDKDHFPINTEKQARNALGQVNKYKKAPKWYKGNLDALVKKVATAVKKKYKDIEVTKKSEKPGKG